MVVKIYVSGISGNKEVKKRQQRVLMILDSKNIKYEIIDITEPGRENDKDFMQNNSKNNGGTVSDPNPRSPLPPQIFNDEEYCGDYDQFDLANEVDTLEQFLKIEPPPAEILNSENEKTEVLNGDVNTDKKESDKSSKEGSQEKEEIAKSKEGTPNMETTSVNADTAVKEISPLKDDVPVKEDSPVSEANVMKPAEREGTPSEKSNTEKESSETKESSPEKDESVNENGTVSSREHSVDAEEKVETEKKKESASESLIESEKLASTE